MHDKAPLPETPALEVVTFRLRAGEDPARFLAAAEGTEAVLRCQPGFLRRRLACAADGSWTDLVEWASLGCAHRAAAAVIAAPEFAAFLAAIDETSLAMVHAEVLWRMD
jgi:hypothetical protein